jgi:hypothetical protein
VVASALGVGVLLSATLAAGRCAGLAFCRPGLGTRLGVMRAGRPRAPGAVGRGRAARSQALLRARNAAELLRSLGITPAPEGTRQILQDVMEQFAEIRGAASGEG